jgi:hypothetical protein
LARAKELGLVMRWGLGLEKVSGWAMVLDLVKGRAKEKQWELV